MKGGNLYKTVAAAEAAAQAAETITLLKAFDLAGSDKTFACNVVVANGAKVTLGEKSLTINGQGLNAATDFTDSDVEKTENQDGTFTYAVKAAVDPVVPGEDIPAKDPIDDINNNDTIKEKYLKAPEGVTTTKGYRDLFQAVEGATPGTVKFVLTTDAETALATEVADETKAIEVAKIASGDANEIEIKEATPGFYYTLNAAATLEGIAAVEEVLCKDGTVTFTTGVAPTEGDTARFFKISVSASSKLD